MSLMDVFVKIGADTSGLESGISKAKGLAGGLGGAIGTGMKVVGAAVGAATTAVTALAASSVEVGKTFDSSMSQVAATMGVTTSEIGELREFAQEMGATTAFSATQAADALNYMALAGYDANQSMEMLPNVLNLAAAGDMELARASDMVTDAQSALGLKMKDMEGFVDQMAKTASKSNTSVTQLGDAILTVGGTAKVLAGGTTELNTSLGILADNGIKGAEGGTKLRNVILSLSAPTDKAAKMLDSLGVEAVDTATGDLKPLNEIMGELSASLDGMGTAERADVINTIFNKQDIAAVNALLDTSADRWDELSAAIDDSKGAAEAMANTQLDNLAGDITLFKSALEGAQIMISDALTPSLRDFVKFGTEGITKISEGFKKGGLTGAMDAFGEVLSKGIDMIIKKLPDFIDAGMKLLGALGQGIIDNLPTIITAAVEIINKLAEGLIEALPYLAEGAIQILVGLEKGIAENLPTLIPMAIDMILKINEALIDNIDLLVDGAIALITGLAIGLINALPVLIEKIPEIIVKMVEAFIENAPKLLEAGKAILESLVQGFQEAFPVASEAIGGFLDGVKAAFDAVVEWVAPLVDSLVQFFGALKDALFAVLETIAGYIKSFIEKHKNEIDMFITTIKTILTVAKEYIVGNLKTSLTLIRDIITTVLNVISNLIKAFVSVLKGDWSGALNYLKDATRAGLDGIKNLFSNLKDNLGNTFRNIVSAMKDWGHDMIESLAAGIQERIQSVISAVSGVADTIRSYLHFTEPDVGPLADFHSYAPDMMKLFAKGIADNEDVITKQLNKSFDFGDFVSGIDGSSFGGNTSAVSNVVINVYGAVGQPVEELAEIVSEKINNATGRRMIAMGVST